MVLKFGCTGSSLAGKLPIARHCKKGNQPCEIMDRASMITDVFLKRYPDLIIRGALQPPNTHAFFVQAAYIITEDIIPAFELTDNFFKTINNQLSRELGAVHVLGSGEVQHCMAFLVTPYNIMNDSHGLIDTFFKLRISFLELTFRTAELHATFRNIPTFETNHASNIYRTGRAAFLRNVIDELNVRFRDASIPLNYHNGLIQFAEDSLVQTKISQPFWAIVSASQWTNVDRDMKEAVDRRDNNGRDAAGYSMRALESTIKIISDLKGWTTGAEKGASNFLDNLQSKANGKFLSNWEAEMLRQMFREIRNPLVHGEGSGDPLQLTAHQTSWVIEACMSWIKSLVLRL